MKEEDNPFTAEFLAEMWERRNKILAKAERHAHKYLEKRAEARRISDQKIKKWKEKE